MCNTYSGGNLPVELSFFLKALLSYTNQIFFQLNNSGVGLLQSSLYFCFFLLQGLGRTLQLLGDNNKLHCPLKQNTRSEPSVTSVFYKFNQTIKWLIQNCTMTKRYKGKPQMQTNNRISLSTFEDVLNYKTLMVSK